MDVDSQTYSRNGKTYTRHLLRQSFRDEQGRPRKRTLCNLTHCTPVEIEEIKAALARARLRKKGLDPAPTVSVTPDSVRTISGPRFGDLFVLHQMAQRVGLEQAFGDSTVARRALWLVLAAALGRRSRLSVARLARLVALCEILGVAAPDEDALYEALDWLEDNHTRIEDTLAGNNTSSVFLYDVTSSYFEGDQNEMAAYGYNRDGKKGKKQIVIGLLCDEHGEPLSVETFPGNTQDTTTCLHRIADIKRRFHCEHVVLVGDRGMIKTKQKDALTAHGWNYITAITRAQVGTLLKRDVIQMSLFDEHVVNIIDGTRRYVLRRNPVRAREMAESLARKLEKLHIRLEQENIRLAQHPRAAPETGQRNLTALAKKFKTHKFIAFHIQDRTLRMDIDETAKERHTQLDGCYVIETDIIDDLSAQQIHDRYKDLTHVERDFRTMKTVFLDNRPIFVHKEKRTRAHVFTTMLALKITRAMERAIAPHATELIRLLFGDKTPTNQVFTLTDVLEELGCIQLETLVIATQQIPNIQDPSPLSARILDILNIKLPTTPNVSPGTNKHAVATTRKRQTKKKS